MRKKNLTLIFRGLEQEHLGKDVFLVPYYLGKLNGYNVSIVYPQSKTNSDFPRKVRGVELIPLKFLGKVNSHFLYRKWNFFMYLIKNARNINALIRFHYSIPTALMICIYKMLNSSGIAYVKGDIDISNINSNNIQWGIKSIFKKGIYKMFIHYVDFFSCETSEIYSKIYQEKGYNWNFGKKLIYIPNGFDEEYLKELSIEEKKFSEKQNLIITVGRLGSYPKNTEMFLNALGEVDLKDWTVVLIGPIEKSFEPIIAEFYKKNPKKIETVIFRGAVYDKKTLWQYYNNSKVFVLTSRFESYALVLNEAKRFRNYIISTEVGAFNDLISEGKHGEKVLQDDYKSLSIQLQNIIDGKKNINGYENYDMSQLSWENILRRLQL